MTVLQGGREINQNVARELLNIVNPQILNRLHVRDCLDDFYARNVISNELMGEVLEKQKDHGPIAATKLLLYKVGHEKHGCSGDFLEVLRQHGLIEIAKMFKEYETIPTMGE